MPSQASKSPGTGGAARGAKDIADRPGEAIEALGNNLTKNNAPDQPAPLLTLSRDSCGYVWAKVRGVDCLYRVHPEHLDQPVYLAARIAELAHDMYDDDGQPYVHAIKAALEALLIRPEFTHDDWCALVDAAIERMGGGS